MSVKTEYPVVSIITIFFNAGRFIDEAIHSVLAQTYQSWELLLVDDGSTDGGSAIAQDWAKRRPGQVRCLEHPDRANLGMSASRNLGVKHAKGEYIGFLDADDVWLPQKLEQQLEILQGQPRAAMVYGRTEIWFSWTGREKDRARDHSYPLGVTPNTLIEPPALVLLLLENKFQNPTTCSALLRRKVYDELGGFQEAFRGMFEDQAFFLKLCMRELVFVSDLCWARYRQHPESCCAIAERSAMTYTAARLPLLRWFKKYLVENRIKNAMVWRALDVEFQRPRRSLLRYLRGMLKAREKNIN